MRTFVIMRYICLYLFFLFDFSASANQKKMPLKSFEELVIKGDFQKAKYNLSNTLKKTKPFSKEASQLYQLQGDIYKLEGDIDEALVHWGKSNVIRSKIYKKGDYHLAWNYALLSNYHYEKINTPLAKLYADSCNQLIQNLSEKQKLELGIHKIWNILGQSFKQPLIRETKEVRLKKYEYIRSFYFKSIQFIEKHKLSKYYIGKSYHLIANSYFDNCYEFRDEQSQKKQFLTRYDSAMEYYNKALGVWNTYYGDKYYEKGRTYSIMGLIQLSVPAYIQASQAKLSCFYFNNANDVYGINSNNFDFKNIPLKEDALLNLKYFSGVLLTLHLEEKDSKYLIEANRINQKATKLWEIAHSSFKSKNINQNLSIYNLIPFVETIIIEIRKRDDGLPWSIEVINEASQKKKYYDLSKGGTFKGVNSINQIKNSISKNEVVVDFLTYYLDDYYILTIAKNGAQIHSIPFKIDAELNDFNQSIVDMNFVKYTGLARSIYSQIFKNIPISKYKKLIICPEGSFSNIPFEALLISSKNVKSGDYGRLDYLIKKIDIQYILSTRKIGEKQSKLPYKISAFAPESNKDQLSPLPFSKRMIEELEENKKVNSFIGKEATLQRFLTEKSPILHLSGHGMIDQQHSILSGLMFTDSLLALKHISRLKNIPSMVVLNTCNSSLGKLYNGDGVDGFVRSYHLIGVKSSISNLWEVDDRASNELFKSFYSYLNTGISNEQALKRAKLKMLNDDSGLGAPYYWAGHQMVGETLVFENEKTPNSNGLIWILGVLGLVAGIIVRKYLLRFN